MDAATKIVFMMAERLSPECGPNTAFIVAHAYRELEAAARALRDSLEGEIDHKSPAYADWLRLMELLQ